MLGRRKTICSVKRNGQFPFSFLFGLQRTIPSATSIYATWYEPLVTHWITVNYKFIIIANFPPVRSVSVPFLTKWCWNSVCLPCWSDDHGTLFELHGKTNGKFAQHPLWHQGLLVEHLQYNKAVNHWLRKVDMWMGGGRGGRDRGLQRGTKVLRHFCKKDPFCVVGIFIPPPPPRLSTPIHFLQNQCWI